MKEPLPKLISSLSPSKFSIYFELADLIGSITIAYWFYAFSSYCYLQCTRSVLNCSNSFRCSSFRDKIRNPIFPYSWLKMISFVISTKHL
jgi:hypothetical protein